MVSPNTEFGPMGHHFKIDYRKFFHAYKKVLIDGLREGSSHTARVFDMFASILCPGVTPTAHTGCAGDGNGSDSSERDPEFGSLSLQDDDLRSDLDDLYGSGGHQTLAPLPQTLSATSASTMGTLNSHCSSACQWLTPTVSAMVPPPPMVDPIPIDVVNSDSESELSEESEDNTTSLAPTSAPVSATPPPAPAPAPAPVPAPRRKAKKTVDPVHETSTEHIIAEPAKQKAKPSVKKVALTINDDIDGHEVQMPALRHHGTRSAKA
jgi:hypothetical protein